MVVFYLNRYVTIVLHIKIGHWSFRALEQFCYDDNPITLDTRFVQKVQISSQHVGLNIFWVQYWSVKIRAMSGNNIGFSHPY